MPLWTDLENAVKAQVATEPAFDVVRTVAAVGLAPIVGSASATIQFRRAMKTGTTVQAAQSLYVTMHVDMAIWIVTRLGDGATGIGDSRIVAGGAYDLADKLRAKMMGFQPTPLSGAQLLTPFSLQAETLTDLEAGVVGIECEYGCDLIVQHLAQ